MLDLLLFAALPYVAVVLFLLVSIQRYRTDPFSFSSLSSQFLESRRLFWGSVPFHVGILTLFFGHLLGFLLPRQVLLWNQVPLRLFVIETTAFVAAVLTLVGLVGLVVRRATTSRLRINTTWVDVAVYVVLLFEVGTGMWVALTLRWGTSWYTQTVVPYLWSLLRFQPDIQRVVELDLAAQMHIVGAFVLFGLFSFTRLVHALVAPVPYLWRPLQLVIWNRNRDRAGAR